MIGSNRIESNRISLGIQRLTLVLEPGEHIDDIKEDWCRTCPLNAVRPTAACTGLAPSADRRTIVNATIRMGLIPLDQVPAGTVFHCGQKSDELIPRG